MSRVTNVVIVGLGGQGVLKACEILAETAFRAGVDVKKAEVHGMSRRGGSVSCDVRFGDQVLSPMVPSGEADFLVALSPEQAEANRWRLRPGGAVIDPSCLPEDEPKEKRAMNVALLGALSRDLPFASDTWLQAIHGCFPEKLLAANRQAFENARAASPVR